MKIIAVNGSPKANGNTALALNIMAAELEKEGILVEHVHIGNKLIHGCIGCAYCFSSQNHMCVFKDDGVNEIILKMRQADGIILGSPTYYGGVAGTMKCFLDRAFYTNSAVGSYKNKVAATVIAVRRAGGVDAHNQLHHYLNLAEMIIAPTQYWAIAYGMAPDEINQDAEGVQTIKRNAQSMAWLMKCLEAGKEKVPSAIREDGRAFTNFIR